MTFSNEIEYFLHREAVEHAAAMEATSSAAKAAHTELANLYGNQALGKSKGPIFVMKTSDWAEEARVRTH